MKAAATKLSLFVLNPRLSIEIVSLFRRYGIEFRVPTGLKDVCSSRELLVADVDGLNYIKENKVSIEQCLGVAVVNSVEEVYNTVLARVLDSHTLISIGVDLGKRIAYAVLAGGRLLTCGYADRAEEVKSIIEKLSAVKPQAILLGIGAEYLKELPSEILSILENERIAVAYIIEEEKINKTVAPKLVGVKIDNLSEDIKAAIAIAVKVYEKYMLTRGAPSTILIMRSGSTL